MELGDAITWAIKYGILLAIPYFILLASYRLFYHPLKSYPGPLLARISDAYGVWYAIGRRLPRQTWKDHVKYGSIVRVGPNKLVFNSKTALHDIYVNENISKADSYQASFGSSVSFASVFSTTDKRLNRFKRSLIAPLINERGMATFEHKMQEQVGIFLNQILSTCQADPNAALNMSERCSYLGLDIVGHLAFGYDLCLQTEETHRFMVRAMMLPSWRFNVYLQYPGLRKLGLEPLFILAALARGVSFVKAVRKMANSRVSQGKQAKHDLYSAMVNSLDNPGEHSLTIKAVWNEAVFFLPAGGDTISTANAGLFFYLAKNPDCKNKLVKELQSAFRIGSDIRAGPKIAGCRYLRACIDETLRMSPPTAGSLWRVQSPESNGRPLIVDGHVIPQGTLVAVNTYAIQHNEEYFPDPFKYKPERWLPTEAGGLGDKGAVRSAFSAFSLGARGCAGKAMAYQEASLTLAKTLWYFDFEFAAGCIPKHEEFELLDVFTATHDGPFLTFQPRDNALEELSV